MYITTHIHTIRPISVVRASFKPKSVANAAIERRENKAMTQPMTRKQVEVVPEPLYVTEAAVTAAILDKSLRGLSSEHYAKAIAYQKYLKSLNKSFVRRAPSSQPKEGTVFVPGYAN